MPLAFAVKGVKNIYVLCQGEFLYSLYYTGVASPAVVNPSPCACAAWMAEDRDIEIRF